MIDDEIDDDDLDDIDGGVLTDIERDALRAEGTADDTPLYQSVRDHLRNQIDQRMDWLSERLQDPYERAGFYVSLGMLDWSDLDRMIEIYYDDRSMDEILAICRYHGLITPLDDLDADELGHDLDLDELQDDLDDDSDTDYRRGQADADWLMTLWDWVVPA